MDITGIDIAGLLAGLGAFFKSLHSDTKTKAISEDRERAKVGFDSRFTKIETVLLQHDKRLDEGSEKFQILDQRLNEISQTLSRMEGKLSVYIDEVIKR